MIISPFIYTVAFLISGNVHIETKHILGGCMTEDVPVTLALGYVCMSVIRSICHVTLPA